MRLKELLIYELVLTQLEPISTPVWFRFIAGAYNVAQKNGYGEMSRETRISYMLKKLDEYV